MMVDRQALFSGTEAPPEHLALDCDALLRYLAPRLAGLGPRLEAVKFKGGQSNPTYRLTSGSQTYVLRRRPAGKLLASAHAIDREYRVMNALAGIGFPAPRTHLYCDDESVIGSHFYIVDCIDGRVFWNAEMPGVAPSERAVVYDAMNALLARLHQIDPVAIGLGDFGPTENYAARNLARWSKIYVQSKLVDLPDMDWLMATLTQRLPVEQKATLLHGDFGLYNIILHPERPEILAVLDWEMSTLGDPFIDLAHHVRPWWELPDHAGGSVTSLVGQDLDALGIPTMDDYISRYCERMAVADLPDRDFYLSYAQFRYAAMVQGVLKRAAEGNNANRTVLHTQDRVADIARIARATLE